MLDELSHPGVVRLLFSSQDARCLYLGMEPLRGGELHAKLQKEGPLDIGEARALAAQVVEVIGHLRKHGIIHRDIKPENLVFGPHGRLVLCDFG